MLKPAFPKPAPRERKPQRLQRRARLQTKAQLRSHTPVNPKRSKQRRGPPRDRWYMNQVKAQRRCEAAGMGTACWDLFDPCHTGQDGGAGMKSSDYSVICMCRGHHQDFDQYKGVFAGWTEDERSRWAFPRVRATQERFGVILFLDLLGLAVTFRACPAPISARPVVEDPVTHYVVCRGDLPRGATAAQIVHAAGESSPGNLDEGTYAVVLAVANEAALRELAERLRADGIAHRAIIEPTMDNAMTAIGLAPAPKSHFRRWLSSIPLYR